MENDSKQKIITDWNTLWLSPKKPDHPLIFSDFEDVYRELKKFSEKHGSKRRMERYEALDNLYENQNIDSEIKQKIINGQTKSRENSHKELLDLWARAKSIRKQQRN